MPTQEFKMKERQYNLKLRYDNIEELYSKTF